MAAIDLGAGMEHRTFQLDWSEDPPHYRAREDLPSSDPESIASANAEAQRRAWRVIEMRQAEGWQLDGPLPQALRLERRMRRVLLPTPGLPGPIWVEYVGAKVRMCRPLTSPVPRDEPTRSH